MVKDILMMSQMAMRSVLLETEEKVAKSLAELYSGPGVVWRIPL